MVEVSGAGFVSLDDPFGILRPPAKVDTWEQGRAPRSKSTLTTAIGRRLVLVAQQMDDPLLHGVARSVTFLWAMEAEGTISLCVEEVAEMPDGSDLSGYPRRRSFPSHPVHEKKLGHPTLVAGGQARVAGELFLDMRPDGLRWYMNVKSGRYCRQQPPSRHQIAAVLAHFQSMLGKDVRLDDIRAA